MLNPDPIVRAGVLSAPECMVPGRVQLKRSVQLVLQEFMKAWVDDENVDLIFSITVSSKRLGASRAVIHDGLRALFAEDALRFRRRETDKRPVYYVLTAVLTRSSLRDAPKSRVALSPTYGGAGLPPSNRKGSEDDG